jgi:hypothetical protein
MERTGCKSPERARNKIENCLANGKKLSHDKKTQTTKTYGGGFVLCVKDNVVVTIYRPTTAASKRKVYAIHKAKRERYRQAVDDLEQDVA